MKTVLLRRNTYWFRGMVEGKLIQRSLKTSDEAEAIVRARALIDEIAHGDPISLLSWPTAIERFIAFKTAEGNSAAHLRHQRQLLTKTSIETGTRDPADVTQADVEKWMALRKNPRTRLMFLEMLSRFFRYLVQHGHLRANPCDGIQRPKKVPRAVRKRFLSREDAERLLMAPCGDDLRFLLFCALHAGLRVGEICAARPEWFDLSRGLLHVTADAGWRAKDGDDRTIPLTPQFRAFLESYGLRSPYMLRPEKAPARAVYRVDMRVPFLKHLAACGIRDCTFHDLRRTFASLHVSAGTSIYLVAKWLGDAVAVVERHYGHLHHSGSDISRAWQ